MTPFVVEPDRAWLVGVLETLGRTGAAATGFAIVVLSVVPPGLRPVVSSQGVEHGAIFLLFGLAFGLAVPRRLVVQATAALVFTGAAEVIQMLVPGRHARWSDFVVDSLGVLAGLAIAAAIHRVAVRLARPSPSSAPSA
ncbi:VanZ family protein [Rhodoplanes azumiensis]|uniref:VanZ family protein n=1 Tax=Rhodoplanes azumiensis TaxID=1897628 RepID=A0ABW5ANL8_9BRAD